MQDFERIYACVRKIPHGKVLSYGDVGRIVGVTARTVGWAMADCPKDLPWHRVVGHDGSLRTAKRSPEAYAEQKARLTAEGITFPENGRVPETDFWDGEAIESAS